MNDKPIILRINGRPVGKGRPRAARMRNGRGVVLYTPERTRAYEQEIRNEFILKYGATTKPLEGPVTILVKARVRTPTARPDGSNILKLVEDALNGLAYKDDAQVTDARVIKIQAAGAPWLEIRVEGGA